MKFNEKLSILRKQHGLTQEQLAEICGVSRQAVSRWESGDTSPEISILAKICETFHITADYLINDKVESESEAPFIKQKNEEIQAIAYRNGILRLISAISFVIGAFCAFIGMIVATNQTQMALSSIWVVVLGALAIIQFSLYYRKR